MRRRRFLAALGATVGAGCSGTSDRRRSSTTADSTTAGRTFGRTGTTGSTPATDASETVADGSDAWLPDRRVVDQRTVDRTLALSPSSYVTHDRATVELGVAAPATADGPAVVRATLTNANEFENTVRLDETPPFDATPQVMPETTRDRLPLYLAPTEGHDLHRVVPEYERADDGRWLLVSEDDWLPETVTLNPRETVRGEYYLLGHPDSEKPPVGRYGIAPPERGRHATRPRPALGLTAWRTSAPGPDGGSAFAGADPPSLPVERETNWYHDADPETRVYLEPSAEQAALPADLAFTLHNHSREGRSCEFYRLYRAESDGWQSLARGYPVQACYGRSPGERTTFRLRAFPDKVLDGDSGMRSRSMQLDPGRYAFAVGYDEVYAALFELADPGCKASR